MTPVMETLADHMLQIPHARALGMHMLSMDGSGCIVRIPYAAHLVGDPDTGIIHGGVISALLDNTCGMAVRVNSDGAAEGAFATLDLRIDYFRGALPGRDIFAFAQRRKLTRNIAFVHGVAYETSVDDPIATCVATFMLGTTQLRASGAAGADGAGGAR